MTRKNTTLGPGPERMTNRWLNELTTLMETYNPVQLKTFCNGVVWGCEPTLRDDGVTVHVSNGAVLINGQYKAVRSGTITLSAGDDTVIIYVTLDSSRNNAVLAVKKKESPAPGEMPVLSWPKYDHTFIAGNTSFEASFDAPVLAYASYESDEEWRVDDARFFVRSAPNGATIIVGDLNAGADFDNIQSALNHVEAHQLTYDDGHGISHRIVVTTDQYLKDPLFVRCSNVHIEGAATEGKGASKIVIRRDHNPGRYLSEAEENSAWQGAAVVIDDGVENVTVTNFRFEFRGAPAECCIYNPGFGFVLTRSEFISLYGGRVADCIFYLPAATRNLYVSDNTFPHLRYGLFILETDGETHLGVLSNSRIEHNNIGRADGVAIDCGIDGQFNSIRNNAVGTCETGVVVGLDCSVVENTLTCTDYGVVVDSGRTPDLTDSQKRLSEIAVWNMGYRGSDIINNAIMVDGGNADYGDEDPWERAGVRLNAHSCYVLGNNIVFDKNVGAGIVCGPVDMSRQEDVKNYFAACLRGDNTIGGNNIVRFDDALFAGIGISMLCTGNRIINNAIANFDSGVLVTAYNLITDNQISPTATGVFAWCYNTVSNNHIGFVPQNRGLSWSKEYDLIGFANNGYSTGAVMISYGNQLDGNSILTLRNRTAAHKPWVMPWQVPGKNSVIRYRGILATPLYADSSKWITRAEFANVQDIYPIRMSMEDKSYRVGVFAHDWAYFLFEDKKATGNWMTFLKGEFWNATYSEEHVPPYVRRLFERSVGDNSITNNQLSLYNTDDNVDGIVLNGFTSSNTSLVLTRPLDEIDSSSHMGIQVENQTSATRNGWMDAFTSFKTIADDAIGVYRNAATGNVSSRAMAETDASDMDNDLSNKKWWLSTATTTKVLRVFYDTNRISGTTIQGGNRGITAVTGRVTVDSTTVLNAFEHCINLGEAPASSISDSVLETYTGTPLYISAAAYRSSVNDTLIRLKSHYSHGSECVRLYADKILINDCVIRNEVKTATNASVGIRWYGDFGVCSGCWFYTRYHEHRSPGIVFGDQSVRNRREFGISKFKWERPKGAGNLVVGANFANSEKIRGVLRFGTSEPLLRIDASPILYSCSDFKGDPMDAEDPFFQTYTWGTGDCIEGRWDIYNDELTAFVKRSKDSSLEINWGELADPLFPPRYHQRKNFWTNRVVWRSCYVTTDIRREYDKVLY